MSSVEAAPSTLQENKMPPGAQTATSAAPEHARRVAADGAVRAPLHGEASGFRAALAAATVPPVRYVRA